MGTVREDYSDRAMRGIILRMTNPGFGPTAGERTDWAEYPTTNNGFV